MLLSLLGREGLLQPMRVNVFSPWVLIKFLALYPLMLRLAGGIDTAIHLSWVLPLVAACTMQLRLWTMRGPESARQAVLRLRRAVLTFLCDMLRFSLLCQCLRAVHLGQLRALPIGYVLLRWMEVVTGWLQYAITYRLRGPELAASLVGYDLLANILLCVPGAEHLPGVADRGFGAASAGAPPSQYAKKARVTSATKRTTSLVPGKSSDRCTVVDEGPHFNRVAKGCTLAYK